MNKFFIICIIILFILLTAVTSLYNKTLKEKERFEANQTTLMTSLNNFKFRDSLNAVENGRLKLNLSELKELREADFKLIKELKLRPKDVETITKVKVVTRDSIIFQLKDSCINYESEWTKVSGCIGDTLSIETSDSIAFIAHKEYKHKFLFFRWGLERAKVKIINFNPRSNVKSPEWIDLK